MVTKALAQPHPDNHRYLVCRRQNIEISTNSGKLQDCGQHLTRNTGELVDVSEISRKLLVDAFGFSESFRHEA